MTGYCGYPPYPSHSSSWSPHHGAGNPLRLQLCLQAVGGGEGDQQDQGGDGDQQDQGGDGDQ